jgi:hypothetical protein
MTPEELEKQRQQEQAKREQFKKKFKLGRAILGTATTIGVSQIKGLDRINQTINEKIASLQDRATDQLFLLASDLGIEGLETGNPILPNLCPPQPILDKVLNIRNNLIGDIEVTAKYLDIVSNSLNVVSDLLNGSITTLTALNVLKTASSAATKIAPVVPGAVTALLSDLDDIRTILTFKTDGNPRLPELKRAVDLGSTYISEASQAVNTILQLLSFIDQVLIKCGRIPKEIPLDISNVIETVQNVGNTDLLYKGFTFEIVEKYFTPTLNQKIGQARNRQGIVLLQTEPSFTQDPQVLIEELKLIIDRDNLKAD